MTDITVWLGCLSLAIWVYLIGFHSRFWRADQHLPDQFKAPDPWPEVVAVVPARDEADVIARSLASLVGQEYPGAFSIVLVDDASSDGTGDIARHIAATSPTPLQVIDARPLAAGWTGKLAALDQGVARAAGSAPGARYLWFTDADIVHPPGALARLVAKAEGDKRDLVSLMVRLNCAGFWERLIIPAFVFFFQMLYPFPAVNDDRRKTAAAAGGCVLLRRRTLATIGGLAAIKDRLIDDCALAGAIKAKGGRLWLGLGHTSHSIRPYDGLGPLWNMIARGAYTQLGHSPLLLAGTIAAMAVTYLAPAVITLAYPWHGQGVAAALAAVAWLLMTVCYRPSARAYGRPSVAALALPAVALLYALMTIDSAWRHWRRRGGQWKARRQIDI